MSSIKELATGIAHIGLPTSDIGNTINFYKSLGFEPIYQTENKGKAVCFLRLKNLVIETYENGNPAGKAGAIEHIAIDVNDIDEAYRTIKEGGYDCLDEEIKFLPFWANGTRFFKILGPNSEIVEFCSMVK
ncbi:VOC family protein [Lachnospiraceae bacterium ZAX-1]